jgi:DNA segregation ATPase FtsK/SpoIIIE, S-DNA-T family
MLWWLIRFAFRHPVLSLTLAVLEVMWLETGWLGMTLLAVFAAVVLAGWPVLWPVSFARRVAAPALSTWRERRYRRRWAAVMTISGLAPWYQGRIILPVLGKVRSTRYVDLVHVRLVSGQSAAEIAEVADNLAHGFGAILCRVRSAKSGAVLLEFVRRDALAQVVRPAPVQAYPDLRALEVGMREDGLPWLVKLHGTHVLVAGATGAGKASLLWGLVRAMFPQLRCGLARILAADPKLMELAYGRVIFETHGAYAADPLAIAAMLDQAVADMQARAARFAGVQRNHTRTRKCPFVVVLVDEVAFLTAYQPDRKLRERIMNAQQATKSTVASVLRRLFAWAREERIIPVNPALELRTGWGGSVRRRVIIPSIPQVLRLAQALDLFKPGLGMWRWSWRSPVCAGRKPWPCRSVTSVSTGSA